MVSTKKGKNIPKEVLFSIGLCLGGFATIVPMLWIIKMLIAKWQQGSSIFAEDTLFLFLILILFSPILLPFGAMLVVKAIRNVKAAVYRA